MRFPFGSAPRFAQIGPPEAHDGLNGFVVLDVRGPDEFVGPLGHVAGARLVPLHTLPVRIGDLGLEADARILVVCRSGARSSRAAALLGRSGFGQVHNLAGGMLAWRSHGLPVCGRRHGAGAAGVCCDRKKAA